MLNDQKVDRLLRQQEITPSTTDKGKGPDETEMEQLLGGVNPWAPNGLPASLAGLTTVHLGIAQEQISSSTTAKRKGKSTWLFRKLFKSNKPAPPHRPRDITSPTQNYSENYDVSGGGLSASPIKVTQPAIRTMADIGACLLPLSSSYSLDDDCRVVHSHGNLRL